MNEIGDVIQYKSKKEIQASARRYVTEVLNAGTLNPLDAYITAKKYLEYITEALKALKSEAEEELAKHGKSEHELEGVNVSMRNTGDRLDYEQDEVYKQLSDDLKSRKEVLDLAYKIDSQMFDNEGVEIPKVQIKTFGGQVINVKL